MPVLISLYSHSLYISVRIVFVVFTLASSLKALNCGIAIAAKTARTATTTTNSIKENPLSPGLRLRTLWVLDFERWP